MLRVKDACYKEYRRDVRSDDEKHPKSHFWTSYSRKVSWPTPCSCGTGHTVLSSHSPLQESESRKARRLRRGNSDVVREGRNLSSAPRDLNT